MADAGFLKRSRRAEEIEAIAGLESEEFLRAIIETTPECIKVVARDGGLLQMNSAGLRMIGADSWQSVAGSSVLDLIAPEHRDAWRSNHERVCRGDSLSWDFDIISRSGVRRHTRTHAAPIRLADGAVGQLAVTRDVSVQKRLDQELLRRERFSRELFEALPAAVYTTDAGGRVTFFNRAAADMAGREPQPGDKWCVSWKLYSPEGVFIAHDQCPMARSLRERRPIRGQEILIERPDGTRVPVMPFPTPMLDDDGELIGGVNMLVDVSDRKAAEQALHRMNELLEVKVAERTRELEQALTRLRETERNFSLLVGGVTDYALYMLDPTGKVVSWNAGAERIKGYKASEIIGRNFSCFFTDEDRQAGVPQTALREAEANGRFESEGWRMRKDGSRFLVNAIVDAIHDQGKLVGFAKITRDITEKKAAEAQLYQAQKMEAVGQLTGGVAHDFNNLLAAIVPSLELARARVHDERALKFLDSAAHAAVRGSALTHQLLAFSRRQHLTSRSTDVNALINQLCEMLPRTLGPTISIERRLDPELWPAMSDPSQLELALLNIAINARDAMPGGGNLVISSSNANFGEVALGLGQGDYVLISVTDTGEGMTEEVRSRAFEPFFSTKMVGQGSGLGLSMVYGFARQSDGVVMIDSAVGQGTTIRIYLPRAAEAAAVVGRGAVGASLAAGPPSRVLIVDDDAAVREATTELVRSLGHTAADASGGEEALRMMREAEPFDLMIVDLVMPNMNGAEFAAQARAQTPQTPVMFVTGYSDTTWTGGLGEHDLLKKPFNQVELAEKLHTILTRKRA
ncbi:MAG TPA: PAS domain S-box protein [Caulobacteraceae bacterium]|nr:PAS domain S-box protein [Caulobacteraceae bacterium]